MNRVTANVLRAVVVASIPMAALCATTYMDAGDDREAMTANAWAWLEPDIGWATPKPAARVHSPILPTDYEWEMSYPAGYTELRVIPRQTEQCTFNGREWECHP